MAFDNVRLDPTVSYGFSGGPGFRTDIATADGSWEERTQNWRKAKFAWNFSRDNWRAIDIGKLYRFYLARRGSLYSFRFLDHHDYSTAADDKAAPTAIDQALDSGDGTATAFQLRKQCALEAGDNQARTYVRDDILPIHGEVATQDLADVLPGVTAGATINMLVAIDGTPTTAFAFDMVGRRIIFNSAPANGAQITWGGFFDNVARFGEGLDEQFQRIAENFSQDTVPDVPIESVPVEVLIPESVDHGGYREWLSLATNVSFSQQDGKVLNFGTAASGLKAFAEDPTMIADGGPVHWLHNSGGTHSIAIVDHLGAAIGTLAAGTWRQLFVKSSADGTTKTWWMP